jgi:lysophospholipase L1-like esterase
VLDWMEQAGPVSRAMVGGLMRVEGLMNALIRLKMAAPPIRHLVEHANFISGGRRPLDAVKWLLAMNKGHIHSEKVAQHVLILAGANDAFQPAFLAERQEKALTAAKSITKRVFSAHEKADQHCQIGNLPLACRTITDWLDGLG